MAGCPLTVGFGKMAKNPAWGGSREGAGRPGSEYPRQNLIISCTDAEFKRIKGVLSTRERAEVLLSVGSKKKGPRGENDN